MMVSTDKMNLLVRAEKPVAQMLTGVPWPVFLRISGVT